MPLTQEQFQKAKDAGFSVEQIIGFEKQRDSSSEVTPQRTDRLQLKSSTPYDNYSYGDAMSDTGKTVANGLADLGDNAINTVKSIPQIPGALASAAMHPIQTVGSIGQAVGNKVNEYNSMDKLANKVSTDPIGFGSDVVGAAGIASGIGAIKEPLIAAGKVAIKPATWSMAKIKEAVSAGKDLKAVETELAGQPMKQLQLQTAIRDARTLNKASVSQMTENFKAKNQELNVQLDKLSQVQAGANKEKLQQLFKNVSTTYRHGLDQAEESLAKRGVEVTPVSYTNDVIEKTINELRDKGFPEDSPAFNEINNLKESLSKQYKTNSISLNDLKNIKNQVYDTLSSGVKSGSKYADSADQVANIFLKNHGQYIGQLSPEIASLNKEFAPMANARAWASKTFRPYNENEIQRGANVLSKLAKSEVPNATDLNYLKQLEEGSGRFKGAGNLRGDLQSKGKSLLFNKKTFDIAKKNLLDATDFKINKLQNELTGIKSTGIDLGFKRDKLKSLVKTRNTIVGLTLGTLVGPTVVRKGAELIMH